MIEALFYLLAIGTAETLIVLLAPLWGVVFYIIILTIIIIRSALVNTYVHRRLILSLALVPLLRITNLTIVEMDLAHLWLYPTIYLPPLLAAVAVIIFRGSGRTIVFAKSESAVIFSIFKTEAKDIGLNSRLLGIQLGIGATGVLIGIASYPILKTEPAIFELIWHQVWLPVFILLSIGFIEELIFRGVIQRGAVGLFGNWGILYVSILFAVLYIGFLSIKLIIFAFIISLYFGWIVKTTKSILGVALAHGLLNITLYFLFPFFRL